MTSTSAIKGTGLKKCIPTKRAGCFNFAPIEVIDIDDVLVARIQSLVTIASSDVNNCCFTSKFSTIASTTKADCLNSLNEEAACRRETAAVACSEVMRPLSTNIVSTFRIESQAACAAPSRASNNSTVWPATAATCAIPVPMAPLPTTPITLVTLSASDIRKS